MPNALVKACENTGKYTSQHAERRGIGKGSYPQKDSREASELTKQNNKGILGPNQYIPSLNPEADKAETLKIKKQVQVTQINSYEHKDTLYPASGFPSQENTTLTKLAKCPTSTRENPSQAHLREKRARQ